MSFRTGISLTFVVLFARLCAGQTASSVNFNLNWYSTPPFPFNSIVGRGCNPVVTTGVVIADFNRDGIPDGAYSYPSCAGNGGVIAKLGTGGGNLGPDIYTNWGAEYVTAIGTADFNGDGWLDLVVRDAADACLTFIQGNATEPFSLSARLSAAGGLRLRSETSTMTGKLTWPTLVAAP